VIGAPEETAGGVATEAGSVFVYGGTGASWIQQARLQGTGIVIGDQLGKSVDISGDTIVTGAPNDDVGALTDGGSAVVFQRNAGTWTQSAALGNSLAVAGNGFGVSVSVRGDEIAVGADCFSGLGCAGTGNVEIFRKIGAATSWTLQQRITPQDGVNGDSFGFSVDQANNGLLIGAARATGILGTFQGASYWLGTIDGIFANGFE
jgi:hypothetical protein